MHDTIAGQTYIRLVGWTAVAAELQIFVTCPIQYTSMGCFFFIHFTKRYVCVREITWMNRSHKLPRLSDSPCCGFTGSALPHVDTNVRTQAATQTPTYYLLLAHYPAAPLYLFPLWLSMLGRQLLTSLRCLVTRVVHVHARTHILYTHSPGGTHSTSPGMCRRWCNGSW